MFKELNKYGIYGVEFDGLKVRFIYNEKKELLIRIIEKNKTTNYKKIIDNYIHFNHFIKKFVTDLDYRESFRIDQERNDVDLTKLISFIEAKILTYSKFKSTK